MNASNVFVFTLNTEQKHIHFVWKFLIDNPRTKICLFTEMHHLTICWFVCQIPNETEYEILTLIQNICFYFALFLKAIWSSDWPDSRLSLDSNQSINYPTHKMLQNADVVFVCSLHRTFTWHDWAASLNFYVLSFS